jgi:hypothetical protein
MVRGDSDTQTASAQIEQKHHQTGGEELESTAEIADYAGRNRHNAHCPSEPTNHKGCAFRVYRNHDPA